MTDRTPRLLLELVGGDAPPAELPRAGVLTVGSSPERAGFVVKGQGVAEVHCAIGLAKNGGWALKDLGSDYGTRVNGQEIRAVRLKAGDQILIGSRRLRVVDPESAPEPAGTEPASAAAADAGAAQASGAENGDAPLLEGYRIVRLLGRGGMGRVFLAVQQSLQREVALKVLSAQVEADSALVRRLQAEARAAAALNHPNVVTVHDVGESAGVHYISMEYMDAGNLEDKVARAGPLAAREVLAVLRDAASGLVYAESKGSVHRDIKPANLMQNKAGTTKIADLGLATHVDAEEAPEGRKVFGTPHFMSPEQARGERLDPRSDLYSLGATAYRLLSGRTPFEGRSSREILRAHLRDEPRPLSELVPGIDPRLAALVARLMQKDPERRFQSAGELLRELERLAAPSAPPAPAAARAPRDRARPRLALLLGAPLLALAAVAAWLFLRDGGSSPQAGLADATTPGAVPPLPPLEPVAADAAPGLAPPGARAPEDDDTGLKLREAEARVALLELDGRALGPLARRDALRGLARDFRGTTAADEALRAAERIEREAERRATESRERDTALAALLERLKAAAALDAATPRPADALGAMARVEGQAGYELDEGFRAARRALEQAVIDRVIEHARERLAAVEARTAAGAFEGLAADIEALLPVFALPADADQRGLERLGALRGLEAEARERLAGLDSERGRRLEVVARSDALAVARALAGPEGLERELATLELEGAARRVAALRAGLEDEAARRFAAGLEQDLTRAASAFAALAREFEGAGWRRSLVTDPRQGRAARDAVGVRPSGLLLDAQGDVEELPWSCWGRNTRELQRLFHDRLQRPWTADERGAIAALMRFTALAEALVPLRAALAPDARRALSARDQDGLRQAFDNARAWADGEEAHALEREEAAALLLAAVLERAASGRFSEAAAGAEQLLSSYADTLLVRLCSEGTWQPAPEAPFVPPAATRPPVEDVAPAPDAPEPGDGDGAEPPR